MKLCIFFIFLLFDHFNLQAQYVNQSLPQYPEEWNSRWITHPDIDEAAYGILHFRNTFTLEENPDRFIIHVSGDNRYRLYVNGVEVGYGPQLDDIRHWRYETYDIAPYLRKGQNILAAGVINWGIDRSYGILSFKTAFLLQGHSKKETIINTGYHSKWKVIKNDAWKEKTVYWMTGGEIVGGFYASNPSDSIIAKNYPWGWKNPNYEDSSWKSPEVVFSQPKTNAGAGHGWILQARTTAIQVSKKEVFTNIIRTDIPGLESTFIFGQEPLKIVAHSKNILLIDQGYVTLGYPELKLSGGRNARIKITYSEALYDKNNQKGNRNETEGKVIKGISDIYIMDGGSHRIFQPLWFRTFRFIQLEIQTENEDLFIEDYYNNYSSSPVPVIAEFSTNDSIYKAIWKICRHCIEICAQDNLLSDAYYEQMQYVGDLRPHLMAWTALTGDLSYFRNAIEQFNHSRLPDGNITSCYPLKATFVHPTYSLIWIDMLHDLMMLEGDKELLGSYAGEIEEVFDYYESLINKNGLVGKSNYQMFIDWYLPKGGNSEVNKDGNSAILTLNYVYTLRNAAGLMNWLGRSDLAKIYSVRAEKYASNVKKLCFDEERGIYADDPEKSFYDQRASILAVLCGSHSKTGKEMLMRKVLSEDTSFDSYANLFYYFYLFEAMEKTGIGDFTQVLKPWKDIVDMGLSATPEKRVEQNPRSEVHPWTAHPVHFYFSLVAGIRPDSPGFNTVLISPNPGSLKVVHGTYPTIHGNIEFDIKFKDSGARGEIILPGQMTGKFIWNGNALKLKPGKNLI